jgi:hypothetical protein
MSNEKDVLFEVMTPLGFQVRVTHAYWKLIIDIKHPVMAGREEDVRRTWKIPTKFARVNRMKTFICFTGQNEKSDGYVLFRSKRAVKVF